MPFKKFYLLSAFYVLGVGSSLGQSSFSIDLNELSVLVRETPMPKMDDSRLGKILDRYYKEGLGGAETWKKVESLRVSGTLTLETGEFELDAFQKKPNFIKMTIIGNQGVQRNLTLGYDGEVAWRILPGSKNKPMPMDEQEARRFIHSAHFGNYLLYPYAVGKKVEYIDTVPVEGSICHHIRVTLETDFQVDYFIDIRSYLEIMVKNTDLKSGFVNSVVYENYTRDHGMPIAKRAKSWEDGEWVSSLELHEIKVNTGLMPWMFSMPE
ncbi:MAG: hypothetical protein AAF546_01350 [Verrucomicrobiota bacterium]